jgi:methylated-DNA-[protein]-cysteine S-methyltransferase
MKSKGQIPPITIQFHCSEHFIEKVHLLVKTSNGITWEVFSDKHNLSLEKKIAQWIQDYIEGKIASVELPLNWDRIAPYTYKVLQRLKEIAFGEVVSYQKLAILTQNPQAARAVGNACGRNPFPLVVPCHRVIAQGGTLGGFSQGIYIKKALLSFEGVSLA